MGSRQAIDEECTASSHIAVDETPAPMDEITIDTMAHDAGPAPAAAERAPPEEAISPASAVLRVLRSTCGSSTDENNVCFICMSDDEPSDTLLSGACLCKSGGVHKRCLEAWAAAQARGRQGAAAARRRHLEADLDAPPLPKPKCPVCQQPYEDLEFVRVTVGLRFFLCRLAFFAFLWLWVGVAAFAADLRWNGSSLEYTLGYLILTLAIFIRIFSHHERNMRTEMHIKRQGGVAGSASAWWRRRKLAGSCSGSAGGSGPADPAPAAPAPAPEP